jgi:creatinine amidohydrolase/Fe(II)-dependent formamide hydrolase-like protein
MAPAASASRLLGELTFADVLRRVKESSILLLPIGAFEQHGAHLPLNTDTVVAEELARRILARWGDELDLWLLPAIPIGLSREHDWAPGTLSLSINAFITLLKELGRELVRALPARNLAIVNGHGGNRGVLDNLLHELHGDCGLNCCVIHPFDLVQAGTPVAYQDVHGGCHETSVMLAVAPQLVRQGEMASAGGLAQQHKDAIAAMVFDRGVSFPWRTDDERLAADGVIGEAAAASVELGHYIIETVIARSAGILQRLLDNQHVASRKDGR